MMAVQTYWADVTPLLEEKIYQSIYRMIPDYRKEKADRNRFKEDRALSIGAWRLHMLAKEKLGLGADSTFNLSHSGKYVLVSIVPGKAKVGCDVEMMKELREPLARRYFCKAEYDWMMNQAEAARREAFYRLWVLKESFMKATRYGMKLGLDTFELRMNEAAQPSLRRQPEFIRDSYFFREYTVPGRDARIAVCSTCEAFAELEEMDLTKE